MKLHSLIACAALTLLTGCAGVSNTMTRDEPAIPMASGFAPIAVVLPPANFCQGAADSDRLRAERAGFDVLTLDRIALQSLQRCRTVLAVSSDASFERIAAR